MPFKLNISDKEGKSWKLESDASALIGKSLGEKFNGSEISPELDGYELEIMGGSDKSGFPMYKKVEGIGIKRVLLSKGWGLHKRPKGDKKKRSTPKGIRLRKTVRGKTISEAVIQINLKVEKDGSKKLAEIFPDQNKAPEPPKEEAKAVEAPKTGERPQESTPAEKPAEAPTPAA